ncbi:MAG: L-threonylcarbamoyladenylate synthase [Pseudomonadota bacterium]
MNHSAYPAPIASLSAATLERAASLLEGGKLVGVPTETVYGLAADATNGAAVADIFAAKGRPSFNPLICHVANLEMAERLVVFNELALRLAERFWPGPLTLVLPKKCGCSVHDLASAGLETLAVRVPTGPMQQLASMLERPVAAPSANLSGRISATSAIAVAEDLGSAVALIIDNGAPTVGVESTIIAVESDELFLLRPGGLPIEDIEEATSQKVQEIKPNTGIKAPGMLTSHYAPDMPVRLNIAEVSRNEALLSFGDPNIAGTDAAVAEINLSTRGDLAEAAQNLFSCMRTLNQSGAAGLAVAPIPETGLGLAINDRLRRAAAPKGVSDE